MAEDYDLDQNDDMEDADGGRGRSSGGGGRRSQGGRGASRGRSRPNRDRRGGGSSRRRWTNACSPRCPGYKGRRVNYKQLDQLEQYVTERGKIRPRRQTSACAKHQRMIAQAIKRARYMALLPFSSEHHFTSGSSR